MEGPHLPGESEGEESSAWLLVELDERALGQYERRLRLFESSLDEMLWPRRGRRRRNRGDYVSKNCEEAVSERSTEEDVLGRQVIQRYTHTRSRLLKLGDHGKHTG